MFDELINGATRSSDKASFVCGVSADAGENVGEPGLRINVVELGGPDERVHVGGPLRPALRSSEHPRFPAKAKPRRARSAALLVKADAAIVEETGKGGQRVGM